MSSPCRRSMSSINAPVANRLRRASARPGEVAGTVIVAGTGDGPLTVPYHAMVQE